jgi:hypothetical protein
VDEREKERARARAHCLKLMRTHIEEQLRAFVERENTFKRRKARQEKKRKVSSRCSTARAVGWSATNK